MTVIVQPLLIFVFDLTRDGGEFSALVMLREVQRRVKAFQESRFREMTDPTRGGRYLMILGAPAMAKHRRVENDSEVVALIRWTIENNAAAPIRIHLRVNDSLTEKIRPLFSASVTEHQLV